MNKILAFTILIATCFFSTEIWSQQPQWLIKNSTKAESKLIDFRGIWPSVSSNPLDVDDDDEWIYNFKEGYNSIYDENGDLSAVITENMLFDASGNYLYTIMASDGPFNDNFDVYTIYDHTLSVVKVPGHCSRYYIFRCSLQHGGKYRLHAYMFDTETKKLIDIDTDYVYTYDDEYVPGKYLHGSSVAKSATISNLSVTRLNENGERFLFFEDRHFGIFSDYFRVHRVKITSSTVEYMDEPFHADEPSSFYWALSGGKVHETEVITLPSGDFLYATAAYYSSGSKLTMMLINDEGTLINWYVEPLDSRIKGMEFSANGQYLYYTMTEAPYLQYITTSSPTVHDLSPTFESAAEENYFATHRNDYKFSSIEIANNGKMYFAGKNGLSSLANPNDPTSLWINNDIDVIVDEVSRGEILNDIYRLIPLPEQVDGEPYYKTTIDLPNVIDVCDSDFEELCGPLNGFPGPTYTFEWWGPDPELDESVLLATTRCFTPTSYGSYILNVTDENGCTISHSIIITQKYPFIPEIEDIVWCSEYEMPVYAGWLTGDPFDGYECDYELVWTFNGDVLDFNTHLIPFQGEGEYCVTITFSDISIVRCFEAIDCCKPNPEFNLQWYTGANPYTIEVNNYPENIDDGQYDSEIFFLHKDCNNDGEPGPWEFVDMISRDDEDFGVDYGDPVLFENLNPNCLYRVMHAVNKECLLGSFIHTEYVGGGTGFKSKGKIDNSSTRFVQESKPTLSPNPTMDMTTLSIPNFEGEYAVEIYNIQGQRVKDFKMEEAEMSFSLGDFTSGLYIIKVSNGIDTHSFKLMKE